MSNSLISFREDESRKKTAITICEEIGIDLQTYLRICITKLIKEQGIPFSLKMDDTQDKALKALRQASIIAESNGLSNMTLDEINTEINKSRNKN